MSNPPPLTPAAAHICERSARLRLHKPLVNAIARRMRSRLPSNVNMDELVQAGLLGLDEALTRFEENRGASFGTYASRRIEGAMLDALRGNDTLSRVTRTKLRQVQAAVQRLEHRLGRTPRAKEVANELGWTITEFHDALVAAGAAGARAEDEALEHERDGSSAEAWAQEEQALNSVADEYADPARNFQVRQRHEALREAFDSLDDRERFVMEAIYEQDRTLADVAAVIGVSPSRVSQLTVEITQKLRERLSEH